MEFLLTHYDVIIATICIIVSLIYGTYQFLTTPNAKQKEQIKIVLLYLVVRAEIKFGSKTGKLKFSYVYSELVKQFKFLKFVPMILVEQLINESLSYMKSSLESNIEMKKLIEGDSSG